MGAPPAIGDGGRVTREPDMKVLVRIAIAQLRREREERLAKMRSIEVERGKAA